MASNPFAEAVAELTQKSFPKVPSWTFPALMLFAVWRFFIMLSCVVVLLIPVYRGKASRKKHLWLIRRSYSYPGSFTPYLVPNRSLLLAFLELVSSTFYITLASLNYQRFKSPAVAKHTVIVIWYGISWLPTYIGIWLAGWGLLYACFGPGAGTTVQTVRFLKPRTHNALWIGWSIFVSAVTVFWAALGHIKIRDIYVEIDQLLNLMRIAQRAWSPDLDLAGSMATISNIRRQEELVLQHSSQIGLYARCWALTWITIEITLGVFYVFIVQHLLRMIRKILQFCESQALYCGTVPASSAALSLDTQNQFKKTSIDLSELRREFRFLALYNCIICLVLACELVVSFFQFKCSYHLQDPKWIAFSSLACMAPSSLMSPALLFQCWRIFTERNASDETLETSTKSNQQSQQPIFREQLMKWYAGPQLDKADFLNLENFPGITEGFGNDLPHRSSISSWASVPHKNRLDFTITREVTTTNT